METTLIGQSRGIREVVDLIGKVADSDVTVLITGESGTGKEVVAQAIFERSLRRQRPFVKMNCAAIPAELLESQMFGHEKGAFTGAVARQQGRFEQAHTGTLFLDEIGDMALGTQTKLLRVLQEREFERVGGKETIHVDVRLLAATNKDLVEEMNRGRFREDLYYRLNVVEIRLPPLRDRVEDLGELVQHFLGTFIEKYRKESKQVTAAAMAVLSGYNWPGNVRELRNVLERAVVLSRGSEIQVGDFPAKLAGPPVNAPVPWGSNQIMTLREMERLYVLKVLEYTGGNKLQAARLLDIDPKTLRSKMGGA